MAKNKPGIGRADTPQGPSRSLPGMAHIFARDRADPRPVSSRCRKPCRSSTETTLIHNALRMSFRAADHQAENKISGLPSPLIRRPSGLYP